MAAHVGIRRRKIDPSSLRGLDQAFYILECLCDGEPNEEIQEKFDGDKQLVDMWLNFLKHNHWVNYDIECHG